MGEVEKDRLLSKQECAAVLGVTETWLDRHGSELPFRVVLGAKTVRYSERGLQRHLAKVQH